MPLTWTQGRWRYDGPTVPPYVIKYINVRAQEPTSLFHPAYIENRQTEKALRLIRESMNPELIHRATRNKAILEAREIVRKQEGERTWAELQPLQKEAQRLYHLLHDTLVFCCYYNAYEVTTEAPLESRKAAINKETWKKIAERNNVKGVVTKKIFKRLAELFGKIETISKTREEKKIEHYY